MKQEAINLQNEAVENLISIYKTKDELTFKAPTGSGKTYMMAKFMNKVLEEDRNVVFLVTSLSKANLSKQNFDKFSIYQEHDFVNLDPYLINSEISGEEELFIPLGHNVYCMPTGLSAKDGRLMRGPLLKFFQAIVSGDLTGGQNKKIYLIKDECHIATNRIDGFHEGFFSKVFNFSATPSLGKGQVPDVEISEEAAVSAKLIKKLEWHEKEDFEQAVCKFEEIKEDYRNLLGINPCMIVQISNKDAAEEELNKQIMPILNKTEHQHLKWMIIVSKNSGNSKCDSNDDIKKLPISRWKEYAVMPTNEIDIIIFKLSITEGWDIPRACILYQVRETESEQLDQQVLGRIRRNPRLLDYEGLPPETQELATTAWAYCNKAKDGLNNIEVNRSTHAVDEIKIKTTNLVELSQKKDFNIKDFLKQQKEKKSYSSIFDLYKKYDSSNQDIKNIAKSYIDTNKKWWNFIEYIDEINSKYNECICDYSSSMELTKEENDEISYVTFPKSSFFVEGTEYINISNWAWKRKDGDEDYSFDSDAESKWIEVIKDLTGTDVPNSNERAVKRTVDGTYLFGKNYLENSKIKYEYYLNGATHWSYPDFIMVDCFGRIHIMEVKSVNKSSHMTPSFNPEQYKNKIEELKKCYKQSSILTGHIFYLPILNGKQWNIIQYVKGEERILTKKQFIEFIVTLSVI